MIADLVVIDPPDATSNGLVRSDAVPKNPDQNPDSESESNPRRSLSRFEAERARSGSAGSSTPSTSSTSSTSSKSGTTAGPSEGEDQAVPSTRVRVDDRGVHRPFMRGILVHSLTEQGLTFEDAYSVSQAVWKRVQGRELVTKKELRELSAEFSKTTPGGEQARLDPTLEGGLDVIGKDGRWPFSQGRLQHSLLAAGIEPRYAFEVVVEIEYNLRSRGEPRVTRDAIRARAGDILPRRFGDARARRYHGWRFFQNEDDRPVILLLGGTSGVGKSSLALEVARRLSIARVLSTDSIRDVMRVMLSNDLVPTLHVSSFEAHSRLVSELRVGNDPVIEGFLEQSRTVSVGVRAVIERAIKEGVNTALDGVSLVPGLFDVTDWQDRAHVIFLLAADEDRESLHGHLVARAHGRSARASERYMQNFTEIFRIQESLLERAEMFGVTVVDVQDLETAAQQVVSYVVDQLGAVHAAEAPGLD
jgi:2-phosphoglycerate kinase